MYSMKIIAATLLGVTACAAESPVVGRWNCKNLASTGAQSPWTLVLRDDEGKLAGALTDGDVSIPLSQVKRDGGTLTFRFDVNAKPYDFTGKIDGPKLEGNYAGEEATGKLQCAKPEK